MKLVDLVPEDAIIADLASADRAGAIRELVAALAASGAVEPGAQEGLVKSILVRERTRGTTGFGKGVAAPHAKVAGQKQVVAAIGRSRAGIDFASLDGEPVYIVFLILSPEEKPEEHLRAMDLIFRNLQSDRFRKFLRRASTRGEIRELLSEADENALP